MDSAETAVHTLATVEAALHPSEEPDARGLSEETGMEIGHERTRPLVEFRSLAHEPSLSETLL